VSDAEMAAAVTKAQETAQKVSDLVMEENEPAPAIGALCWAVSGIAKAYGVDLQDVMGMLSACWAKTTATFEGEKG